MFQVFFIFADLILIKQTIVFSTPFAFGETDFHKILYTKNVYTKTDSWIQKSDDEFGQLQTSSEKSKKLKFDGLLLSRRYIPSAKTLYTED